MEIFDAVGLFTTAVAFFVVRLRKISTWLGLPALPARARSAAHCDVRNLVRISDMGNGSTFHVQCTHFERFECIKYETWHCPQRHRRKRPAPTTILGRFARPWPVQLIRVTSLAACCAAGRSSAWSTGNQKCVLGCAYYGNGAWESHAKVEIRVFMEWDGLPTLILLLGESHFQILPSYRRLRYHPYEGSGSPHLRSQKTRFA